MRQGVSTDQPDGGNHDGHTQDGPDVQGGEQVSEGDGHEDLHQHGQAQEVLRHGVAPDPQQLLHDVDRRVQKHAAPTTPPPPAQQGHCAKSVSITSLGTTSRVLLAGEGSMRS